MDFSNITDLSSEFSMLDVVLVFLLNFSVSPLSSGRH